ncbi:hypothetical protein [Shewanella holmiensis]|uniref:Uncharacterized protein n=1 Tax=Shewanella holmiensis TaxID=2952222 RepID=A0A9X3AWF8_9GAMM|nr:hypothetical protein [Shewanella holmiensis]MCT7942303.1 hypothetical protein [Shewanella holmiensis]
MASVRLVATVVVTVAVVISQQVVDAHLTSGSNRSLRSLGRAKARPLTKR